MATRTEIETLISYVLSERNRELLIRSGLDGVPKDRLVAALRGLQDLGWIDGGNADLATSYSLSKEGRRIAAEAPAVTDLPQLIRSHIEAIRAVDATTNGEKCNALRNLIAIECSHSNWDSALMSCFELRKLAERTKNTSATGFALFHIGKVEVSQNRWDEALESYLGALEKYMEAGDRSGVCETNRAMGVVYGSRGDYTSARRCFESSLAMAEETEDLQAAAKARGNLATIYDLQGRTEESENAHKWCLNYFIEIGDDASAAVEAINLGVMNMTRERFEVAAEYFEKAISTERALSNKHVLGAALVSCGYCCARSGQTHRALTYTEEALGIFKEPQELNMLALTYRNFGYIEFRGGNREKAFEWFEKSVRTAEASGVEDTFAACCCEYGTALIKATIDLSLAKKLLKRSSSVYREIGNSKMARIVDARLAAV